MPDGAELLVTGDGVHHQAYRVGDRTWGVQFHFEIDRAEIETWLTAFEATEDLAVTWGKPSDERCEPKPIGISPSIKTKAGACSSDSRSSRPR